MSSNELKYQEYQRQTFGSLKKKYYHVDTFKLSQIGKVLENNLPMGSFSAITQSLDESNTGGVFCDGYPLAMVRLRATIMAGK